MGKKIMKSLNKLFGGINMSWLKVIIFAVGVGIYTGVVNQIPFVQDLFLNIAGAIEWWVLFTIIIVSNCKKWWEAALKVFVFFLICHPVSYLIQIPTLGLSTVVEYYLSYWFQITLISLPLSALLFFINKKNVLSSLILAIPTGYLAILMVEYIFSGPYISVLFCLLQIIAYLIIFTPKLKGKLIAGIIALAFAVLTAWIILTQAVNLSMPLPEGNWESYKLTVNDGSVVEIKEDSFTYYFYKVTVWDKEIIFTSDDGRTVTYEFKDGELIPPAELKE